ncbi:MULTISPECIES: adenosylmethionine--8-amino-7-oxononanoate transaminase [unclassified Bradyrhizobium]|uniref:adenosylmethionine--8-amino-7-oxononanoate transaminase n=1 Tax=unclassified Bradyrhizobium TaxID=2631580 RepID=UPI001FFA41F6|nr:MULTISPECIES: adenosylmethionine--8-amino-7-oxononanoate transaminase [unclassified Bradyrhizobium]MCK1296694.1 adenosylmethionine--8-amino-7-oxononanoate transaminase [Bradyrhizobium sp. 37]MCK1315956.1 adenosylmethionine--8-amino-7-oxononanoate transaminase [Bradyrhizobium sp. 23]MCK1399001.1 adenosylmethionine--8-amino-7-oxononanoate transaminase [Bradyrhizobium sp. 39]MCK1675381.1 adenosylmethionine--8-amino-7-oxononanoate transaminase [Bradyrhizobium sp. 150]MCK1749214.1 adenosylmethio
MPKTKSPIWHPFTQHALQGEMTTVVRADGAYLHTADGRRIIDAISSWWVVTHGHCHPHIVSAIQEQAGKLNQIIFAGYTHDAAEELAAQLLKLAPRGLDYVFFSDSGSTSVEVALKMALGYWHNIGQQRRRIVVMQHSYHGDTVGAMSVGARGVFNAAYGPLLFDVTSIPFPARGREQATLAALESACRNEMPAAFIVEPLILGAGGMLMYPAWVLTVMKRICEASDVLFIADEVMTGWGRTGSLFACEQANVTPDIACYSKGLTGGALPLAVTLCRAHIFDAHYSKDRMRTFYHSSSYTANPVACAAAKANLDLWWHRDSRERAASLAAMQERAIEPFRADARFENVRRSGTITALDLKTGDGGYLADIGPKLQAFFNDRNLLLRPLGNTIYVMPPYCVTAADLDEIYAGISDAADALA